MEKCWTLTCAVLAMQLCDGTFQLVCQSEGIRENRKLYILENWIDLFWEQQISEVQVAHGCTNLRYLRSKTTHTRGFNYV